ncbi:unnamed protein product [Rotaria sordida]|uniref:Uncharacterized protein n=1 Tax=Rotaria sordida TaxID=392033 RepID=A0A820FS95_9BILA|nr:unnamed protein product [Rotaria sordida]
MNDMSMIFDDEQDDEEWTSTDDDDDDDDGDDDDDDGWILYDDNYCEDEGNKLSYHHREPEELKDLDWNALPNFIHHLDYNQLKIHERQKAHAENRTLLSIRRKMIADKLICRLPYKGTEYYITSKKNFQQKETDHEKKCSSNHPY